MLKHDHSYSASEFRRMYVTKNVIQYYKGWPTDILTLYSTTGWAISFHTQEK